MKNWTWQICLSFILIAPASQAATIAATGSFQIATSSFPVSIEPGDIFYFALTYDDSVTDTDPHPGNGVFPNALLSFALTADSANFGSWNPAGGTFPLSQIGTCEVCSQITFVPTNGSGFPAIAGNQPTALNIFPRTVGPIVDTGLGQTLAEQLGSPLQFNLASSPNANIFFGPNGVSGPILEFTFVPEPGTFSLGVMTLLWVVAYAWRRGRRTRTTESFSYPHS